MANQEPHPPSPPSLSGPTLDSSLLQSGPASSPSRLPTHSPPHEGPGTTIGPYKILRLIGEGGFGTVFMAQQEQPVQRSVALKIIKLGMDTRQVVARFEQERQALALMDHPNIARVLDAGSTDSGRPYFVMELVKGEPIVQYCDKNNLSIPDRLELFAQVCHAVQHAHTKGIIHRDIKPSNILVSMQDGNPSTKIIDFGIAKATSARLTEQTVFTEHRQLIGTPEYMSPEQAEGSMDIDTRTDVYSLGVLLYELLTGTTPFSSNELRSAAYAEIQRLIREVEPPIPSTRLSKNTDTLIGIAARRHTEPRKLGSLIRGELDWIVMKALEKDRLRRYETANGFAMDVRRYLAGEAVLAAPPSRMYAFRKFVRRNRAGVTAAGLVTLALILGLVGTGYGLQREAAATHLAQNEAARAVKAEAETKARADELTLVAEFQSGMLEQIDPTKAGKDLSADVAARFAAALAKATPPVPEADRPAMIEEFKNQWDRVNATDAARELIDRTILKPAIKAIDEQFQDQPVVDARLRQALASRYNDLGLYDRAMPLLTSALATRRRVLGEDHLDTINSIEHMGKLLLDQGKASEAEPYFRETYEKRKRVQGEQDPLTLASKNNLGDVYRVLGRFAEAEPLLKSSLEDQRRTRGNEDVHTMASMNTLGQVYIRQGKRAEAEVLWREAYETARRVLGEDDRNVLVFTNNLSMVNMEMGKLAEAESLRRELLTKARRVWGEEHPDTLTVMSNMGQLLLTERKLAEAEPFFRESLEKRRRVLGDDHPDTLFSCYRLGNCLKEQGKLDEAEVYLRESLEKRRRILPAGSQATLTSIAALADVLDARNKPAESEPLWRELLDARIAAGPAGGAYQIANARSCLGGSLLAQNKFAAAEPLLIEGYEGLAAAKDLSRTPRDILREAAERTAKLYEMWNKAEPGKGFDAKAADWKTKLAALPEAPKPEGNRREGKQ